MGILAFVCPATGKSVFTDLEIDQSIYSSILKNRLSHMYWGLKLPERAISKPCQKIRLSSRSALSVLRWQGVRFTVLHI